MLGKATILPVNLLDVAYYWPRVIPFILRALDHTDGEISTDKIRSDIDNQERQLWVIKSDGKYIAAIITRIYKTETGFSIGEITMAGGRDHYKWDHFTDVVGEWFKSQGCKHMDIIGRPGWQRLYRDRGFRLAYTQLRKDL